MKKSFALIAGLLLSASAHAAEFCTLKLDSRSGFNRSIYVIVEQISCSADQPATLSKDRRLQAGSLTEGITAAVKEMDQLGWDLISAPGDLVGDQTTTLIFKK